MSENLILSVFFKNHLTLKNFNIRAFSLGFYESVRVNYGSLVRIRNQRFVVQFSPYQFFFIFN
jgi:hypothetical protein